MTKLTRTFATTIGWPQKYQGIEGTRTLELNLAGDSHEWQRKQLTFTHEDYDLFAEDFNCKFAKADGIRFNSCENVDGILTPNNAKTRIVKILPNLNGDGGFQCLIVLNDEYVMLPLYAISTEYYDYS